MRRKVTRPACLAAAAVAVGMVATLIGTGTAVSAGPTPYAGVPILAQQTDLDEGGTADLREQLEAASKGFIDAKAALENSTKRQKQLAELIKTLDADVAEKSQLLSEMASRAYRTGRLGPVSALIASGSENFVDRAAALDAVAANEDRALRSLQESREQQARAKAAIDAEIAEEEKQVEVMAKRKQQAERALAAVSAGPSGGFGGSGSANAQPAPRNPDGSWPNESCSQTDPSPFPPNTRTGGCLTPRTLHALNQARAAGFKRFVSCFRPNGGGDHPEGQACDFAAQPNGFGGTATGDDRTYGNNLANYFVNNAGRLGVSYVIWFRQIWLPSSGWRAYNGGGDPSSDHTNHVHLSMH